MKRIRKVLVICCAILVGAVGLEIGVRYMLGLAVDTLLFPQPVTDVQEYPPLLAKWSASGLTTHFPSSVPPAANEARLSSVAGFPQAGAHLQLYVRLPAKDVAAVDATCGSAATHTFQGGDAGDHANQPNGVPTTSFYTSGTKGTRFDSSFNIYVFSAEPAPLGGEGDFLWNHGCSCGVAVSRKHGEVVYWVESW